MNFITVIMLIFSCLGALDRILGNRFGFGKEFERGFLLLGNTALSVIGMIIISPFIADILSPCFGWFYNTLHIDPSIIPASLFANDMGGAPLAMEITQNDTLGMFNALVVSSMMGCTITFSIPYALGAVEKENHRELFFGLLCGLVTIPAGCMVSGMILNISFWQILLNLLPLIIFSGIVACGLVFLPQITVKIFAVLGKFINVIITMGLVFGLFEFLTGIEIIKGLADITEAAIICLNISIILSGAFPLMYIVSKILSKPIQKVGKVLEINSTSAMGFISTIVSNITTFDMMKQMDKKGIFLNSAFIVAASFMFGDHLAFTMAFDEEYILALIVAKLVSGLCALGLAVVMFRRICSQKN